MTLGSTKPPKPLLSSMHGSGHHWMERTEVKFMLPFLKSCTRFLDHPHMCFPLFLLTFELGELNIQARVGT